jgi:hypothetical protein
MGFHSTFTPFVSLSHRKFVNRGGFVRLVPIAIVHIHNRMERFEINFIAANDALAPKPLRIYGHVAADCYTLVFPKPPINVGFLKPMDAVIDWTSATFVAQYPCGVCISVPFAQWSSTDMWLPLTRTLHEPPTCTIRLLNPLVPGSTVAFEDGDEGLEVEHVTSTVWTLKRRIQDPTGDCKMLTTVYTL